MTSLLLFTFVGSAHYAAAIPLNPVPLPTGGACSTQAEQLGCDGGPADIDRAQYGDALRGHREDLEYTHAPDECLGNLLDGYDAI